MSLILGFSRARTGNGSNGTVQRDGSTHDYHNVQFTQCVSSASTHELSINRVVAYADHACEPEAEVEQVEN